MTVVRVQVGCDVGVQDVDQATGFTAGKMFAGLGIEGIRQQRLELHITLGGQTLDERQLPVAARDGSL